MTFGLFESFERLFRFDVVNNSGEVIPPFACMELDYEFESGKSALSVNGSTLVVSVKKPTADNLGSPERFLINGPMSIAIDGFGSAYKLPILQVLMDIATPPSPGDTVGPTEDSWLLSSSGSGWVVKSLDAGEAYVDGDTASVFAEMAVGGSDQWFILAEDIAAEDQETVKVWLGELSGASIIETEGQETPLDLVNVNFCLSPEAGFARAGFAGRMGANPDGDGRLVIRSTYGCINSCSIPEGYDIEQPEFDDATEGDAYTFTLTLDGTIDDLVATNLPDGLTLDPDTGEISGTPTTAGEKWVRITGTAGGCTITRLALLTVLEP